MVMGEALRGSVATAKSRPIPLARSGEDMRSFYIDDILPGLQADKKFIRPKYFYDQRGSQLFELITKTTEYYVTRAETEIFTTYAEEIAELVGRNCILIEPGAGNCEKVESLLTALTPAIYLPTDIAESHLQQGTRRLLQRFPWLHCMPVAGSFENLVDLPVALAPLRRVVFFPGSTIGNFDPEDAIGFMRTLHQLVDVEGGLLIGVDLEKEKSVLERAYNDSAGVTALFNVNVLHHINRITGANFRSDKFKHLAFYNEQERRIEMHLCSLDQQTVTMGGHEILFASGEGLHTENSYKYSTAAFTALAAEAGFVRARTWHDNHGLFALHYFIAG
jgi:dimethylhistidine N-methyltransferase